MTSTSVIINNINIKTEVDSDQETSSSTVIKKTLNTNVGNIIGKNNTKQKLTPILSEHHNQMRQFMSSPVDILVNQMCSGVIQHFKTQTSRQSQTKLVPVSKSTNTNKNSTNIIEKSSTPHSVPSVSSLKSTTNSTQFNLVKVKDEPQDEIHPCHVSSESETLIPNDLQVRIPLRTYSHRTPYQKPINTELNRQVLTSSKHQQQKPISVVQPQGITNTIPKFANITKTISTKVQRFRNTFEKPKQSLPNLQSSNSPRILPKSLIAGTTDGRTLYALNQQLRQQEKLANLLAYKKNNEQLAKKRRSSRKKPSTVQGQRFIATHGESVSTSNNIGPRVLHSSASQAQVNQSLNSSVVQQTMVNSLPKNIVFLTPALKSNVPSTSTQKVALLLGSNGQPYQIRQSLPQVSNSTQLVGDNNTTNLQQQPKQPIVALLWVQPQDQQSMSKVNSKQQTPLAVPTNTNASILSSGSKIFLTNAISQFDGDSNKKRPQQQLNSMPHLPIKTLNNIVKKQPTNATSNCSGHTRIQPILVSVDGTKSMVRFTPSLTPLNPPVETNNNSTHIGQTQQSSQVLPLRSQPSSSPTKLTLSKKPFDSSVIPTKGRNPKPKAAFKPARSPTRVSDRISFKRKLNQFYLESEDDAEQLSRKLKISEEESPSATQVEANSLIESEQKRRLPRVKVIRLACREEDCSDRWFHNETTFFAHQRKAHGHQRFWCPVRDCGKSFNNRSHYGGHIRDHLSLTDWNCNDCTEAFSAYKDLKFHYQMCHEIGEFGCLEEGCDFVSECRQNFVDHEKEHRETQWLCYFEDCDYQYTSDAGMLRHEREVHLKERPFRCIWDGCNFESEEFKQTKLHVKDKHLKSKRDHDPNTYIRLALKNGQLMERDFSQWY